MAKHKGWGKKSIKPVVFGLTMALSVSHMNVAYASSTMNKAKEKKNEIESQLNSTNNEISEIEGKQTQLRGEIQALDRELVDVIVNLNILQNDLTAKEAELVQVQADLEQAKVDEANQFEAMKKRIRFMYERGDTALLDSLVEAHSFSDFLNRVEYYNDVYDYDRGLLDAYQAAKDEVARLEIQVQGDIAEMEEIKHNFEEEKELYEALIAEKKTQSADFESKLSAAQELASQYQATIAEQNRIIRAEEQRLAEEAARKERERKEAERKSREEASRVQNNAPTSGSSVGSTTSNGNLGGSLNPGFTTGVDGGGVAGYALQFVGGRYVYGGTDPNTGADCSGFTSYVYRNYGVHLPRTSGGQRSVGREVSYANAQPGDLICYSGHVAIYIGGGQIVHASSSAPYPIGGIKTGSATYRTIIAVRRVL